MASGSLRGRRLFRFKPEVDDGFGGDVILAHFRGPERPAARGEDGGVGQVAVARGGASVDQLGVIHLAGIGDVHADVHRHLGVERMPLGRREWGSDLMHRRRWNGRLRVLA